MKKWRIEDSEELYNIKGWGVNYFGINEKGHVTVSPKKNGMEIDLKEVVDHLASRHVAAPVLLRFPDILDNRIEKTDSCFRKAAKEYNYQGEHFIIFPIKVNQMRPVVEEIISHGKRYNLGLEAGSKPELHAVLATNMDSDSLIICKKSWACAPIWAYASSWLPPAPANGARAAATPPSSASTPPSCSWHCSSSMRWAWATVSSSSTSTSAAKSPKFAAFHRR